MAAFTVCAKLAAMNVRMAIGAMRAYILENQACVAFGAGHFLVHAAQWITRAVMIKLGIRPDRFPISWQSAQCVLTFLKIRLVWHLVQVTFSCMPRSG